MAVNDVYELTLRQVQQAQEINNVFFYHQALEFITTLPTQAQALAEEWVDQILPGILAFQNADVATTQVVVKNLYDASDGYTLDLALIGLRPGTSDSLTTFTAIGFTLSGDNPAVKQGAKRFTGIDEGAQVDGVITAGDYLDLLDECADLLESPVLIGTVITDPVFLPVVVKRVRTGSPGAYEYRLPGNPLEATLSKITVALAKIVLTSQVSRKIGVGI